jgi:hypothetical protein
MAGSADFLACSVHVDERKTYVQWVTEVARVKPLAQA